MIPHLLLFVSCAGPMPAELGALAELKELWLHINKLEGKTLTLVKRLLHGVIEG